MENCRLSPFLPFSIMLHAVKSNMATNKQRRVLLFARIEERKRVFRSMLKNEWKKLLSNRLMLVVVLAVIAIPTIYNHPVSRFHVGPLRQRGKSAGGAGQ